MIGIMREDGWIVRYCNGCGNELTDPRWQQITAERDLKALCRPCGETARRRERAFVEWRSR